MPNTVSSEARKSSILLCTSAYIGLSIRQDAWKGVAEHLSELPYVEHFALVGGDFDVLLLVRTPDNAALRDVVLVSLQALDGVRSTRTWLIFDEADGPGALGPPDPGTVGQRDGPATAEAGRAVRRAGGRRQTTPRASIAFATRMKPAMFAPVT
mgnify:CR=1 FL=1